MDAAQTALFEAVKEAGALLGQSIAWKPSGGVCEGNNLHAAGLPNIDTLGVVGHRRDPEPDRLPQEVRQLARPGAAVARDAARARVNIKRRKERAAMLAYNVAVIAMLLTFFAYLSR